MINAGATSITGRSILNDRAICDTAQEHAPETETIQAHRAVLNTLGDGFVEAVADATSLQIASDRGSGRSPRRPARQLMLRIDGRRERPENPLAKCDQHLRDETYDPFDAIP